MPAREASRSLHRRGERDADSVVTAIADLVGTTGDRRWGDPDGLRGKRHFGPSRVVGIRRCRRACQCLGVATKQLDLVLRSGPGDGLTLTACVDLDADCLALLHRTGYTYETAGALKGRRIFDWLPSAG